MFRFSFFVVTFFLNQVENSYCELVRFSTFDNIKLTGKLTIPSNPKGVFLILQGSGNVSFTGDVSSPILGFGEKQASAELSTQMAQEYYKNGIATFSYSKRGYEDSRQLVNQTIPYLTSDAEHALNFLHDKFPRLKIGIVGISEGATIATLVANKNEVNALQLLSLPTRPIDKIISYQFKDWPINILSKVWRKNGFHDISTLLLSKIIQKPPLMISIKPNIVWNDIDKNQDDRISFDKELRPAYNAFLKKDVYDLFWSDQFRSWYSSYQNLSSFDEVASHVRSSKIFLYQGAKDAQINPSWVIEDMKYFLSKPQLTLYPSLGHCFSHMAGKFGEIKTSGPLNKIVLEKLSLDAIASIEE